MFGPLPRDMLARSPLAGQLGSLGSFKDPLLGGSTALLAAPAGSGSGQVRPSPLSVCRQTAKTTGGRELQACETVRVRAPGLARVQLCMALLPLPPPQPTQNKHQRFSIPLGTRLGRGQQCAQCWLPGLCRALQGPLPLKARAPSSCCTRAWPSWTLSWLTCCWACCAMTQLSG